MAKKPDERFANAEEMVAAIDAIAGHKPMRVGGEAAAAAGVWFLR
jgi:hypothetical protein